MNHELLCQFIIEYLENVLPSTCQSCNESSVFLSDLTWKLFQNSEFYDSIIHSIYLNVNIRDVIDVKFSFLPYSIRKELQSFFEHISTNIRHNWLLEGDPNYHGVRLSTKEYSYPRSCRIAFELFSQSGVANCIFSDEQGVFVLDQKFEILHCIDMFDNSSCVNYVPLQLNFGSIVFVDKNFILTCLHAASLENFRIFKSPQQFQVQFRECFTLLIGDRVCSVDGDSIDIDRVMCMGVYSSDKRMNLSTVFIVVNARNHIIRSKSMNCHSSYDPNLYDCDTDIEDDLLEMSRSTLNPSSPNDCDNTKTSDFRSISVPSYIPIASAYYLIQVVIERGKVTPNFVKIFPLGIGVLHDQIPAKCIGLSDHLAIIYGSNGLLTLFQSSGEIFRLAPFVSDESHNIPIEDNLVVTNDGYCVHGDITSVYCQSVSGFNEQFLVVSGDSNGCVSLWTVYGDVEPRIISNGYRMIPSSYSISNRVNEVFITKDLNCILVSCIDRLLLLRVNGNSLSHFNTFETIDVVPNGYPCYSISNCCYSYDSARIWRVISKASSNEIAITSWTQLLVKNSLSPSASIPTFETSEQESTPAEDIEMAPPNEVLLTDCRHLDSWGIFTVQRKSQLKILESTNLDSTSIPTSCHLSTLTVGPLRSLYAKLDINSICKDMMRQSFGSDSCHKFRCLFPVLNIVLACYQNPSVGLVAAAADVDVSVVIRLFDNSPLVFMFQKIESAIDIIQFVPKCEHFRLWLIDPNRACDEFWLDVSVGHSYICALHLRFCGNKSVAIESPWHDYLKSYGPSHLRKSSRKLRELTQNIRKIDETIGLKDCLPLQVGYISGLQEIYARRVGLRGKLPNELGLLKNLRVLSMGNNQLCGRLPTSLGKLSSLQRIVLHQNILIGEVPEELGKLGCIINLAGNTGLEHGEEVPYSEREALVDLYNSTSGPKWVIKTNWSTSLQSDVAHPVASWYKIGVLFSHVHSIVMSSNGMEGCLPSTIGRLKFLRMIELATMPGLIGHLPRELCQITTLRRLCICRCSISGPIPEEIGCLTYLEELQLFGNNLTGPFPESIGNLTNLKLLSLGEYTGGNNFMSSSLPYCLSKLKNLEALFMANCNLKGCIPSWIAELRELRQLDLQRNYLVGGLPDEIGGLSNLLYLNLKDNEGLNGNLPINQMKALTKLNRLSLVHCNFTNTEVAIEALHTSLPRCKIWL